LIGCSPYREFVDFPDGISPFSSIAFENIEKSSESDLEIDG
jgi:hypothetical protein